MAKFYYCAVYGCRSKTSDKNISFFKLPVNPEICKEWLQLIDRPDLLKKSNLKPSSYKVCSVHFEDSAVNFVKQLKPGAVPTKFLEHYSVHTQTSSSDIPDSIQTNFSTRKYLSARKRKLGTCVIHCDNTNNKPDKLKKEPVELKPENTTTAVDDVSNCLAETARKLSSLRHSTTKSKELELNGINVTVGQNPENTLSVALSNNEDEVTIRFRKLIEWQSSIKKKYKGNRQSSDYKFFVLNLFSSSPQMYRSLIPILNLPSESTLISMKLHITPKFENSILDCLSCKLKSLPKNAKYCTMCIGNRALQRHLHYGKQGEDIIGFHNINGKITKEIAANAYVIMLRGIIVNWKQPIAYGFLANTENYEELDSWITEVITKLLHIGIHIVAVVTNQNSNFDKYAKQTRQITVERPYFMINYSKIYYIFDVPHLIKSVRNNLMANDFCWQGKIISWNYLKILYTIQRELNLGLIPNVTESHLNPNSIKKTRIKYAAQIFSRSVHAAFNTFICTKLLPEEARPTGEFILLMNNLFDILNSSKVKSNNENLTAFTGNKYQIEILQKAKTAFQSMKTVNPSTRVDNTNKTFKNMLITMQSIIMLYEDLVKENLNFLFTRHLNQEPLEIFFRVIRQQGGKCYSPTSVQFTEAFSKQFLNNMLRKSINSTCEPDLCDWLLSRNN